MHGIMSESLPSPISSSQFDICKQHLSFILSSKVHVFLHSLISQRVRCQRLLHEFVMQGSALLDFQQYIWLQAIGPCARTWGQWGNLGIFYERNEFWSVSFSIVFTCQGNNLMAVKVKESIASCPRLRQMGGEFGLCFLKSTWSPVLTLFCHSEKQLAEESPPGTPGTAGVGSGPFADLPDIGEKAW